MHWRFCACFQWCKYTWLRDAENRIVSLTRWRSWGHGTTCLFYSRIWMFPCIYSTINHRKQSSRSYRTQSNRHPLLHGEYDVEVYHIIGIIHDRSSSVLSQIPNISLLVWLILNIRLCKHAGTHTVFSSRDIDLKCIAEDGLSFVRLFLANLNVNRSPVSPSKPSLLMCLPLHS